MRGHEIDGLDCAQCDHMLIASRITLHAHRLYRQENCEDLADLVVEGVLRPGSARYFVRFTDSSVRARIYTGVQQVTQRAEIPLIEVAAAFSTDAAPTTLYAYLGAHCSTRGYQLAARTIIDALGERKDVLTLNQAK